MLKKIFTHWPALCLIGLALAACASPAAGTSSAPASTLPPARPGSGSPPLATVTGATPVVSGPVSPGSLGGAPADQGALRLLSLRMVTSSEGWAIGGAGSQVSPAVLHTFDGGAHWVNIRPAQIVSATIQAAYFAGPDNAWLIVSPGGSLPVALASYRTNDGGRTWETGESFVGPASGPGFMTFMDKQHGWYMAGLGAGAGSMGAAIYKTEDGGASWTQVSLTTETAGRSTPGSLPLTCIKSGLGFVDSQNGWATGACAPGPLFLYVTHDGGKTWTPAPLVPPPGYPNTLFAKCQCAANAPVFIGDWGAFPLTINETSSGVYLYVTRDRGATWKAVKLPVARLVGSPNFVDANTGWITDGSVIYTTRDGGQTWTPAGQLPTPDIAGGLRFVSGSDGWVLGQNELWVTHNGAKTWSPLKPALAAATPVTPAPAVTGNMIEVTLDQQGQTITLQVGQRLVLKLGEDFDWDTDTSDPAIVSRVPNITPVRGSQGVYEARKAGTTQLVGTGDPPCRKATPPCAAPSRAFSVTIVVR